MSWWHGRKGREKSADSTPRDGLRLGTGDRLVFSATDDSNELARQLLVEAQERARDLEVGTEVTIEVEGEHFEIHHMELMISATLFAPEYGLEVVSQFNNSFTFAKR